MDYKGIWMLLLIFSDPCYSIVELFDTCHSVHVQQHDGRITNIGRMFRFRKMSKIRCAMACLNDRLCLSFVYEQQNRNCHLHHIVADDTTAGETTLSQGAQYYEMRGCERKKCSDRTIDLGYSWEAAYGLCYKIGHETGSWNTHSERCAADGGRLLTVTSYQMHQWLVRKILDTPGLTDNRKTDTIEGGSVRLVGCSGNNCGRVEVYYDGVWGTVCDDYWDDVDASVVCRMFGFRSGVGLQSAYYGQGSEQIWMDDVGCAGDESSLITCDHLGWGLHNCGHHEDASVLCAMYPDFHINGKYDPTVNKWYDSNNNELPWTDQVAGMGDPATFSSPPTCLQMYGSRNFEWEDVSCGDDSSDGYVCASDD